MGKSDLMPWDFAEQYAQSDDFRCGCRALGITPSDDPEERVRQAQRILREDPILADICGGENN